MKKVLLACLLALAFAAQGATVLPRVIGRLTTQNLVPAGECTANSCVEIGVETAGVVTVQVTGSYTGALSAQVTTDGATWVTLGAATTFTRLSTGVQTATIGSGVTDIFQVPVTGVKRVRVTGLAAMTGTAIVTIQPVELSLGGGGSSGGGGGGAVTVADGSDSATGSTSDVAANAGGTGTISAKLRLATSQLEALGTNTTSTNSKLDTANTNLGTINTSINSTNSQLPTTLGQKTSANSLSTVLASDYAITTSEADSLAVGGTLQATGVLFTQDLNNYRSISVQVTSAGTATITYEQSEDNINWTSTLGRSVGGSYSDVYATNSTATGIYQFAKKARYFRARVSSYTSGTVTVVGNAHKSDGPIPISGSVAIVGNVTTQGYASHSSAVGGAPVRIGARAMTADFTAVSTGETVDLLATTVGAQVTRPYSIPEQQWSYAAASGGISNTTTAVTVQAAAGVGVRNFITNFCVQSATLSGASELLIRDGAAGTVIFRTELQTTALPLTCTSFPSPLRGSDNTLLEVAMSAAVTGKVYVNFQGYTAP